MNKKNYRLRDLMLTKQDMELLEEISSSLNMRNTDFARILLQQELLRIKALGVKNYRIAVIGEKSNGK